MAAKQTKSLSTQQLEEQIRRLKYVGDDLRGQIFDASQRGHRLAASMGFDNIEDAEAAISERPAVFHRDFIEQAAEQIHSLEVHLKKHVELDIASRERLGEASREIEELKKANSKLREELDVANRTKDELRKHISELEKDANVVRRSTLISTGLQTPTATVTKKRPLQDVTPRNVPIVRARKDNHPAVSDIVLSPPPSSSISASIFAPDNAAIASELLELREKYNALRQAKERNDAKYKADYLKWKNFKRWMFDEQEASLSSVMVEGKTPNLKRVLKLKKQYKKRGPPVDTAEAEHELGENENQCPAPSANSHSVHRHERAASEPNLQSSPTNRSIRGEHKRKLDEIPSSETEDDSQAPEPVYSSQPGLRRVIGISNGKQQTGIRMDRDLEQTGRLGLPLTPRVSLSPPSVRGQGSSSPRSPANSDTRSSRLSLGQLPVRESGSSKTPTARLEADKENDGNSSHARKSSLDYSAYKGRGRYATDASNSKSTINAVYQIDSAQNDGRNHQYDDVVRNKELRKHLHAGDCECCHDYYEAVGPLPPRLHPPVWRSPESTPSKPPYHKHLNQGPLRSGKEPTALSEHLSGSDPGFDVDESIERRQQAIAEHKHSISRHRQQWQRASTPPDYWNIGFPDTQEAAAINRRAHEMHEQKRARIEVEASRGGRYKKR